MEDSDTTPTTEGSSTIRTATRRDVLKATAGAGALTAGIGFGAVGSVSAGIPTPWLTVNGNLVQTEGTGETLKLRGLNIADPKRINVTAPARGKNAEQVVRMVTDPNDGWHPRMIRIPCQPIDIGEHTPGHIDGSPEPPAYSRSQLEDHLATHVDPIVDLCEQRGVYAIVDMHRHWKPLQWAESVPTAQDETGSLMNQALHEEVMTFWDVVGPRYADRSHVMYEIYNEPTEPGMWADVIERDWCKYVWDEWQAMAQPWVDRIREAGDNLVLVGSPGWSTSPEGALYEEFQGGNLGYTYHIYPGHNPSRNQNWDALGTNAQGTWAGGQATYEHVPLFVTEFGWNAEIIDNYLRGSTTDFGEPFMNFLESSQGIHWTAWVADPIWLPNMFDLGSWADGSSFSDSVGDPYSDSIPQLCSSPPCDWPIRTGENMGQFIKDTLANLKDDGVPSGDGPVITDTLTPTAGNDGPGTQDGTELPTGAPQDLDGDGLYMDVNGNGRLDNDDVVSYFEGMDSDPIASDTARFDYNQNGRIDFDDLVTLFEQL